MQGTIMWLQVFSRQLIVLTGAAAELVGPSVSYLKIRAWSAPAVLITMVAQVSPAAAQICCTCRHQHCNVLATVPSVHQRKATIYHQHAKKSRADLSTALRAACSLACWLRRTV